MKFDLNIQNFIEFEVLGVTRIKGKYGYRVKLIYADGSIRTQQKSGYDTMKEAGKARDETVGELYAGKYVVYNHVKLKEFQAFWIEEIMKPNVSAETTRNYRNAIYNHIGPKIGNLNMTALKRSHIQALYKEEMIFSPSMAEIIKTVMNTSLEFASDKKVIAKNPAKNVNLPKKKNTKGYRVLTIDSTKTLDVDQMMKLMEASKNTPIHMHILFGMLMGLRRGEICGVKYSDIDYIGRKIHIQRQLGRAPGVETSDFEFGCRTTQEIDVKTSSSNRWLPIPDYVFEAILEQRKVYERNREEHRGKFRDDDYICCSEFGKSRSMSFHFRHYKQLLKDNNLPNIRFHDLRATFCTLLLTNNFSEKAISKLMGHAKSIVTVDVYGDNARIIADCVDDIQPFIDEVLPEEEPENLAENDTEDIVIEFEDIVA